MTIHSDSSNHQLISEAKHNLLKALLRKKGINFKSQTIPQRSDSNSIPLSFSQERLWFLAELEEGNAAYNMLGAVRINGSLEFDVLQRAIAEIVKRHEILRTNFQSSQGIPRQIIHSGWQSYLKVEDWQKLPRSQQPTKVQQYIQQEAQTYFNLSTDPLLRLAILQLSSREFILVVNMHHIISDGWSIQIFIKELSNLYQAFSQNLSSPLTDLPIQYADFAIWQRRELKKQSLQTQLSYWQKQLANAPILLSLPTDRPRPAIQTYRGQTQRFSLPIELARQLEKLSRESETTLFMTLLAAFATLLYRYSSQDDILIGSPVANRNRPEIEPLIGFFVNTLVLRTRFENDLSFRELLARVKEITLEAYTNQDVPFEQVVETLKPERSLSYSPLFQVMFDLQNIPKEPLKIPNLEFNNFVTETLTTKFDLSLSIEKTEEGFLGIWEYSTDLFNEATIARMAGHFQILLEGIVTNPHRSVSQILLLTEAEQHQLLFEWNHSTLEYNRNACIHQLFEEQVERTPNEIAVVDNEKYLTYQQLNQKANQLAYYLQTKGIQPQQVIGICDERSLDLIVSVLATLKAGCAYVPLTPDYPPQRLTYTLEDADVSWILTRHSFASIFSESTATIVDLDIDKPLISQQKINNPTIPINPDDLAYVIYTSGSTGKPKGVAIAHTSLVSIYSAWQAAYQLNRKSHNILQMASFSFDVFVGDLVRALCSGGKLVLCPPDFLLTPEKLYQLIEREKISWADFVPSVLRNLTAYLEKTHQKLDSLEIIIVGSESWYIKDYQQFKQFCQPQTRLINSYGVTEATIDSCYFETTEIDLFETQLVPIGRPYQNTQIYILDRHLQPVPIGVPGELHIAGDGLAKGYLNLPDLTQEKFIAHPFCNHPHSHLYKTGDLARYLPDGTIELLGRIDHQVKLRGFRLELPEIEAILRQHSGIKETAVIVRENVAGDRQLVAYVVLHQEPAPAISDLRFFLKKQLPDYAIPNTFVFLSALPLTPNGKIDRRALPAPEIRPELELTFVAPQTPIEEILANIWADVLGFTKIGIHDNFFNLGGHSLIATQVISRLRNTLKVELPLRNLFEYPTVAELAQCVEIAFYQQLSRQQKPLLPIPRNNEIPLSFSQASLWFLDRLQPNSPFYNIPIALYITGQLNLAALENSIKEIIQRHEILRTNFTTVAGQPLQVIIPSLNWKLQVISLRDLPENQREIEARRLVNEEARRPFNLEREPLLRATVLQIDETKSILLITLHHIIADGWSIGILVRELAEFYKSSSTHRTPILPDLPIQYGDFTMWQVQELQRQEIENQLDYWKQQLKNIPSLLELPTDRSRPAIQTFRGAYQSFAISQKLSLALMAYSKRMGITLFMLLLSAFQTLLYRYTGQDDIVVGTPVANRNRQEIEGLIGFFVNILVMRTDLSGDPSFEQVVNRVKEVALQAYAHQNLPFEKLVEVLQPERSLSYAPLFQVMFALDDVLIPSVELPNLTVSAYSVETGTAKFDLTLSMENTANGLSGVWEYSTDLFDETTITRMAGHFQILLEGIVANPKQTISTLPLLTEAEQNQLLVEWNDTEADYPKHKCIHQLFEEQTEKSPDAVALVCGYERLTYRELNARANQLAHYLQKLGVESETLVGICVERSPLMVIGLLGILKAGGTYIPLDPSYPQERLVFMLEDAQVSLLLTQQIIFEGLLKCSAQVVYLDNNKFLAGENTENLISKIQSNSLAYILYTSGSTGKPKGVAVEHRSVVALLSWATEVFTTEQLAGVLASTSFCFDISVFELFVPLSCGGKIILAENILHLPTLPAAQEVTLINTVPSAISELVRDKGIPDGVGTVNLAGEALPQQLAQLIYQQNSIEKVFNLYGPSEDTIYSTYALVKRESEKAPPIGRPIYNTQAYILDSQLQPVPIGVPGELHIGGAGLARGYLNRLDLTAEKFIPNLFNNLQSQIPSPKLYKTGDLARYLPDGNIEFLGRIDHQIKLYGFRLELLEIESVLNLYPEVHQAVVLLTENSQNDKFLAAYLIAKNQSISISDLRVFLQQRLPGYMIPSAFIVLESFPLTPNGKVDRKAFPKLDRKRSNEREFIPPRDYIEQQMAQIWSEVLSLHSIGIRDNFFDLGGYSLLAIRLMAQIQQKFQQTLPLATLFEAPTIEQLSNRLRSAKLSISWSSLVPIQPRGHKSPLFFVPGAGGNVIYLYQLAKALDCDRPFYGLQAQGLDGESKILTTMEEIAAHYVEEMIAVQPEGAYFIAGHSFGSLVAFEIAQQLLRQGHKIAFLAILDSYAPLAELKLQPSIAQMSDLQWLIKMVGLVEELVDRPLEIDWKAMESLSWDEQLYHIKDRLVEVNFLPPDIGIKQLRRFVEVFKTQYLIKYVPQNVEPTSITLFKTQEFTGEEFLPCDVLPDPTLGWQQLASSVEVHTVPGNHITMLDRPHVEILAQKLISYLS